MASPTSSEDWISVARERAADAAEIFHARPGSAGAFYMVGYTIECSLKAYLVSRGQRFKFGREGHNLKALWRQAGLRLVDLGDSDGWKARCLQEWSTTYRYSETCDLKPDASKAIQRAKELSSFIQTLVRRQRKRK